MGETGPGGGDATELEELRARESRLRTILESAGDGIIVVDEHGRIELYNAAAEAILGWSPEEVLGQGLDRFVAQGRQDEVKTFTDEIHDDGGLFPDSDTVYRAMHRDGRSIPVRLSLTTAEVDGRPVLTAVFRDVTTEVAFEWQLQQRATHDRLTGLANRALLAQHLEASLVRADRVGTDMAIVVVDLDRFRQINHRLGHGVADLLLTQVGQRLRSLSADVGMLARLGGDQFAMVIEDVPDLLQATSLAEKVLASMSSPFTLPDTEIALTASVGIAITSKSALTAEDLTSQAEVAVYRAKAAGGDRLEIFDSKMAARAVELSAVETGLRHAVDRGELILHYQPMVDLGDGDVLGYEALLRWERRPGELEPPAAFISAAEESGLIIPIGRWVIDTACRQLAGWSTTDRSPVMSINISGRQLLDAGLADDVARALEETGVRPEQVVLEITESVLFEDLDRALGAIARLHALGVRLALDDFGTGYSSLTYLRQLPVDMLKIDRSFVGALDRPGADSTIVSMIIALGRSLDLEVVAEGIETSTQRDELLVLGCMTGQGFYYATPEPADRVTLT